MAPLHRLRLTALFFSLALLPSVVHADNLTAQLRLRTVRVTQNNKMLVQTAMGHVVNHHGHILTAIDAVKMLPSSDYSLEAELHKPGGGVVVTVPAKLLVKDAYSGLALVQLTDPPSNLMAATYPPIRFHSAINDTAYVQRYDAADRRVGTSHRLINGTRETKEHDERIILEGELPAAVYADVAGALCTDRQGFVIGVLSVPEGQRSKLTMISLAAIHNFLRKNESEPEPVLFSFGASWCGPCQRFHGDAQNDRGFRDAIRTKYRLIFNIDVGKNEAFKNRCGVGKIPVFQTSTDSTNLSGYDDADRLLQQLGLTREQRKPAEEQQGMAKAIRLNPRPDPISATATSRRDCANNVPLPPENNVEPPAAPPPPVPPEEEQVPLPTTPDCPPTTPPATTPAPPTSPQPCPDMTALVDAVKEIKTAIADCCQSRATDDLTKKIDVLCNAVTELSKKDCQSAECKQLRVELTAQLAKLQAQLDTILAELKKPVPQPPSTPPPSNTPPADPSLPTGDGKQPLYPIQIESEISHFVLIGDTESREWPQILEGVAAAKKVHPYIVVLDKRDLTIYVPDQDLPQLVTYGLDHKPLAVDRGNSDVARALNMITRREWSQQRQPRE